VTGPIGAWVTSLVFDVSAHGVHPAGFLGGKLTYRYGVRVADEVTQADGYGDPATRAPTLRSTARPGRRG
jgi:hypothetical protein